MYARSHTTSSDGARSDFLRFFGSHPDLTFYTLLAVCFCVSSVGHTIVQLRCDGSLLLNIVEQIRRGSDVWAHVWHSIVVKWLQTMLIICRPGVNGTTAPGHNVTAPARTVHFIRP